MIDLHKDSIPYFRELNCTQLSFIEDISTIYNCKNGDLLLLQGEFCQNWVIIYRGSLLNRKRDGDIVVDEKILLPGDSFDFESIINSSITSSSLEAIEDCSVLVIDILGLKKLAQKYPIPISLIQMQFNEKDSAIWKKYIFNSEKKISPLKYKIKKSIILLLIKTLPITVLFLFIFYFVPKFILVLITFWVTFIILFYVKNSLTYIEINREMVVKKEFFVRRISSINLSVPLEIIGVGEIVYKSKLYKLMDIGDIYLNSEEGNIEIEGVYRPQYILDKVKKYKCYRTNINKAIELSSFKYLYSRQNGLFSMDSQLESDKNSIFAFKKNIFYFLIRGIPPFFIFLITSIGLYLFFRDLLVFLLNIPSIFILTWYLWDWLNDRYVLEGDKIIDIIKRPFWGKEHRTEADIMSIRSIKKEQRHILQILFNYGDIKVRTLEGEITYPSINNPDKVIDNLYLVKKYYYSKQDNRDKLLGQKEFLNYTKYYQELSER